MTEGAGGASEEKEELEGGADAGDSTPPALDEEPAEELSGGWSAPVFRPPDASSWLNERISAPPDLQCTRITPQTLITRQASKRDRTPAGKGRDGLQRTGPAQGSI